MAALNNGGVPREMSTAYKTWAHDIGVTLDRKLSLDELRKVQASVYIYNKEATDGEDSN